MNAPYDARKIANFVLDQFDAEACAISNKKINKLLFFVHGVSLARLGAGLVKNHFEAWDHGPVVSVVYHAFKGFVFEPIQTRATAFNYVTNQNEVLGYSDITDEHRNFILRVAGYYMRYSADELEAMTHEADSPWTAVRATPAFERGIRDRIPDEQIQRYFQLRLGPAKAVN